jgi:hypothetical protein
MLEYKRCDIKISHNVVFISLFFCIKIWIYINLLIPSFSLREIQTYIYPIEILNNK